LAAQLQHREQIVGRRAHVRQGAHLFGDHAQFLEIDQPVNPSVIAEMNERQILLDNGEKWNLSPGETHKYLSLLK
jgi:hypothetical protein